MIVIIHGPQGCGKSRYARALASHFGLNRIQEDLSLETRFPIDGTLAFTNDKQAAKRAARNQGVVSLSFDQAMTLATSPNVLRPVG